MYFVCFLRSLKNPKKTYVGFTENLDQRLTEHNTGKNLSSARHIPRELVGYVAVPSRSKALNMKRYLKSGSGHAFWHKHFL
jgi:putative endonuclease